MPCSLCADPSHTKAKCPQHPTKLSSLNSQDDSKVDISLPPEIKKKLWFLAKCCQEVANELGKGHTEKVYQEALGIELQRNGIFYIMEQVLPILYKGHQIGGTHSIRLDICLQSYLEFIYELKATQTPVKQTELWQVLRYLKTKKYDYGAVVNFNQSQGGKLEVQFVIHDEGSYYMYNILTDEGTLLNDYTLESEIDFTPLILEGEEECLIRDA
jgi:GxxExxY protein